MKRLSLFVGTMVVAATLLPSSALANEGAIVGATANSTWTEGTVEHVSANFSECGTPAVAPGCYWEVEMVAASIEEGGCPTSEVDVLTADGFWAGYAPGTAEGAPTNGTVEGGPIGFSLENLLHGAHPFDEVCLYVLSDREWEPGCQATAFRPCRAGQEPELLASAALTVRRLECPAGTRRVTDKAGDESCVQRRNRAGNSPVYENFGVGTRATPHQHPRTLYLDNQAAHRMHWHRWGGPVAIGVGVLPLSDCNPNCGAGEVRRWPVRVRLGRIRDCQGDRYYTRLFIHLPKRSGIGPIRETVNCKRVLGLGTY